MGKRQFNALINGHTVMIDAPERSGGEDTTPIPKPFLLTALSGCTGMDVLAILRKQNKTVESFNIKVEGELSKEAPMQYISAHLTYEFEGDPVIKDDAVNAVNLSQDKCCGVSATLKKVIPVTGDIIYNRKKLFSTRKNEISLHTIN